MNVSCLKGIDSIDLSRNHFHHLDENFRRNFANHMPPQSLSMRNLFYCDCNSADWLAWFRSTNTVGYFLKKSYIYFYFCRSETENC